MNHRSIDKAKLTKGTIRIHKVVSATFVTRLFPGYPKWSEIFPGTVLFVTS